MRHPDFADSRGIRRDLLSRDGLHLSPRGGRVLSRYFLDSVAALSAAPVDPAQPAPAVEAIDAAPSPAPAETSVPKTYAYVVADGLPAPASAQRPTQRPAPRRHRRRRPARRTPRSAALPPPTATPPPATSTPPPARKTPPPARKTPPPAKKTPPPATKTPPASKTPAASKTPPATTKTPPPATSTAPRTPSLRASPARSAVSRVKDASPHDSVLISVSDGVSVRLSAHLVKPVWDIQANTCDAPPPVSQLRRKNNHVKKSKSPSLFSCPDCVRKFRTDYGLLEHIIRKHIVRQSTTPSTVKAPLIETVAHRGGGGTRSPDLLYCHDPEAHFNRETFCNDLCSKLYPFQTCDSVCGPAVIIGICLAVFAPAEFQNLVNGTLNNPFSHLRDISRSSKYIRYVIIDWFMTRKLITIIRDLRYQ